MYKMPDYSVESSRLAKANFAQALATMIPVVAKFSSIVVSVMPTIERSIQRTFLTRQSMILNSPKQRNLQRKRHGRS